LPMNPMSLEMIQLKAPPCSPNDVEAFEVRGSCKAAKLSGDGNVDRALFYELDADGLPAFANTGREVLLPKASTRPGDFDVEFERDPLAALVPNLRLAAFTARAEPESWAFELELEELRKSWMRTPFVFSVEVSDPAGGRQLYDIRVNPKSMDVRGRFASEVPEKTARFKKPRFRLASVRRGE
jgi:hypothetical protein